MIYTSFEALSNSINNQMSLAQVLQSIKGMHCGENAGYGFDFTAGQTVEFPTDDKLVFQVITKVQGGKEVNYLYTAAAINGKWQMIPVWALRKKTPSKDDLLTSLRNNAFYMEVVNAANDVERVRLFSSKTWKVREDVLTRTDSKTNKEFQFRIWSFDEIKTSSNKK